MEDIRYQEVIHHLILRYLGNGKKIALRVSGKSMHPLMRGGDPIQIEKCDPKELFIGDIITFKKDGLYVTHRVLWLTKKGNGIRLITKGDNEINTDPPVLPLSVLGKVAFIERGNRTLRLNTPFWRSMNRLLGVISLVETLCIHLYRSTAGRFLPVRILAPTSMKPFLYYRQIKNTGLRFTTGIIV